MSDDTSDLQAQVTALQGRVDALEGTIAALQDQVAAFQSQDTGSEPDADEGDVSFPVVGPGP